MSQDLHHSQSLAEQIVDGLSLAAFLIDAEGRITYWNAEAATLSDQSAAEVIGERCWHLFASRKTRRVIEQALDNGEAARAEVSLATETDAIAMALQVTPLTEGGANAGALCVLHGETGQPQSASGARHAAMAQAALDGVSTSVMMCDLDRIITYVNPANQAMLAKHTDKLKEYLSDPEFDPHNLVGRSIDTFHVNPSRQAAVLEQTTHHHHAPVTLRDLHYGLNLHTLYDGNGERMGYAVEWTDRSDQAGFSDEVARLTEALLAGQLSARGDVSATGGPYVETLESINTVVEILVETAEQLGEFTAALAHGTIPPIPLEGAQGDLITLRENCRTLAEATRSVTETATLIASGDLSVEVPLRSPDDQLMAALGGMVDDLNAFMRQVQASTAEMGAGADQMQTATQSVADNTQNSAASLEETSATMVELAAQTRHNAENAQQALQIATAARNSADTGDGMMRSMLDAMTGINESSQSIFNIIKVIDEIAFQTNLLALNAAVEAARAGAHGKGFAVVAEEVRNLAARSAKAAKETAAMISDSMKRVEQGTGIARNTAEVFSEILSGVTKVSDLIGEIAAASGEQSSGLDQMGGGLQALDDVVQRNAAASEEMAASATELFAQARRVQDLVNQYTLKEPTAQVGEFDPSTIPPAMLAAFQAFMAQNGFSAGAPTPTPAPAVANGSNGSNGSNGFAPLSGDGVTKISLDDADFGRY